MDTPTPSRLRVDLSAIREVFATDRQRATTEPPMQRRRSIRDYLASLPSPPPRPTPDASSEPPAPPPFPVKLPRRSTKLVKAERACRDYDRLAKDKAWLIARRWHTPTIVEFPDLDTLEATAKKRNAHLKHAWHKRVARAKVRAEAIAAGNGKRGWRSRQLKQSAEARKAEKTALARVKTVNFLRKAAENGLRSMERDIEVRATLAALELEALDRAVRGVRNP